MDVARARPAALAREATKLVWQPVEDAEHGYPSRLHEAHASATPLPLDQRVGDRGGQHLH
eukprot:1438516-Prymnesium_polylepis.1